MPIEAGPEAYRVLLLPATRRDGDATRTLLTSANLLCHICVDANELAREIERNVGAVVFTDEAFGDPNIAKLLETMSRQPQWSDVPAVILCHAEAQWRLGTRILESLRNVTLLDRPSSSRTLLSSVQAALRARARQYQLREQLQALQESEAALRAASQRLEDANRRKDEFLAMLAHELRNPLAPILNATEVLDRKLSQDASLKAMVHVTKRQATQLARLVDDLLDVSRITEGRIELRLTRLAVAAIVAQAAESVESLIREKGHALLIADDAEGLHVEGDHARLVQCVANVLTNAAKYTAPGGEIRVEVRTQGSEVVIAVTDNGPGIAPQLLPRIFDLFVQGERTLDRSQGGLGIGLSIVRRLIEMHGGRVVATSGGLGRGATFALHLPLTDASHTIESPTGARAVRSRRILIVDDNVDAANSLAALLQIEGHETQTAYNAADALARFKVFQPDVAVLDIGLPDMDGYSVAARIRKMHASVQIIALTGYGQPDDIRHAYSNGFHGHLTKPADTAALARMIAEGVHA
jgi:two-component system, sensor histidine kinase